MRTKYYYQDGKTFYMFDNPELNANLDPDAPDGALMTCEFPGVVKDFDTVAAEKAARWFHDVWCVEQNIEPVWVSA